MEDFRQAPRRAVLQPLIDRRKAKSAGRRDPALEKIRTANRVCGGVKGSGCRVGARRAPTLHPEPLTPEQTRFASHNYENKNSLASTFGVLPPLFVQSAVGEPTVYQKPAWIENPSRVKRDGSASTPLGPFTVGNSIQRNIFYHVERDQCSRKSRSALPPPSPNLSVPVQP